MPTYNYIFNKLVQSDPDFVGMVAYALYKKQKIEWIQQFSNQNDGQEPSEQDLKPFHDLSNMPYMLNTYRNQAVDLLDEFLEFALDDKVEQIRHELIKEMSLQLQQNHHKAVEQTCTHLSDNILNVINKPWYTSVFENIMVGLITSLITLAAAGLIWVATQGPDKLIQEALQKYTQPQKNADQQADMQSSKEK